MRILCSTKCLQRGASEPSTLRVGIGPLWAALDESHWWSELRPPLRLGPALGALPLSSGAPVCFPSRQPCSLPADVSGVLLAGGCAGALAWAVATPMDVIKSRLQADGQGQRRYRGLLHCVVTSVREEGPRVLFKGLVLNCCRAFPVNMVVFVTYEAALRLSRGLLK